MILTDLITAVRQRSDMEQSQFVKDPEITTYINQSYVELYDLLVSRFEDYFVTDFSDKVLVIDSVIGNGTTTTVTCTSNHNLITGLQITVAGYTGGTGDFNYVGPITKVSSKIFTYPSTGNGTATGGTITIGTIISVPTGFIINLPDDFYKLRGMDKSLGGYAAGDWLTLRNFNFAERNRKNRQLLRLAYGQFDVVYRLFGKNIILRPEDSCSGFYRMWYIPRYTPLVLGTDEPQGVMDFEEYIIVDAAIKCLAKEESDVSTLAAQKQVILERVESMASSRDTGEQEKVGDLRNAHFDSEVPYLR